jgi:hypothetical protein
MYLIDGQLQDALEPDRFSRAEVYFPVTLRLIIHPLTIESGHEDIFTPLEAP